MVENNTKIKIIVTNYGQATAEEISLSLNYSYGPKEIIHKIRELPPKQNYSFDIEIFPLAMANDFRKQYIEIKKQFDVAKKALIIRLILEFDWGGDKHRTKEYTLVYDRLKGITLW